MLQRRILNFAVPYLFGLFSISAFAQDATVVKAAREATELTPEDCLVRSYLAGKELIPEERAFQLARLSQTAAKVQPVLGRLWAEELFLLAFELPMSWNRLAHEKNALSALAGVDPVRAFELFGGMDSPVPTASGDLPEDLRAFGARTVFDAFWKRKGIAAFDDIRKEAEHVGDTGQYPYVAITPILRDLTKREDIRAQSLFGEALSYYSRGSQFRNADEEFIQFLNAVWDVIPAVRKRQALSVIVAQLSQKSKPQQGETFLGRVETDKGMAQFESHSHQLLYMILPRIREIDPDWARRLVENDPVLNQASASTGKVRLSEQVTVQNRSNASPSQVQSFVERGLQGNRLREIMAVAASDPNQALMLTMSLTDPALRAQAFATIATSLVWKDPEGARKLVEQAKEGIATIKGSTDKVQALAALARAAAAAHDTKSLREALKRGFDLGEEIFEEDLEIHPGRLAYEVAGFDELSELTRVGVQFDPQDTLTRVASLRNTLLQAHLLIDAAEALHDFQSSTSGGPK